MIDLNEYDKGAESYLTSIKVASMPLLSWDFYAQHLSTVSKNILDFQILDILKETNNWNYDFNIKNEIENDVVVVVTDPTLKIVFSTQNITKMNGYKSEEIIGKSPKMFQGEATCEKTSLEIRDAIENKKPFEKWVINYKKNGEIYNCHIKGFPIFNKNGEICNFIAFEKAA